MNTSLFRLSYCYSKRNADISPLTVRWTYEFYDTLDKANEAQGTLIKDEIETERMFSGVTMMTVIIERFEFAEHLSTKHS